MTVWGPSNNGYWKLGIDFIVVTDTPSYTDIRAEVRIWTKYATWEGSNSLTISGDWSYSGSTYAFSVTTNSAWSTNNIAVIWQQTKRFVKNYAGYDISLKARLTGVNYPNTGYVESVSATKHIRPTPYSAPANPANLVATRYSDAQITFNWTNNNPGSVSSPYQNLEITAVDENDPNKVWFRVAWLGFQSSYTWSGAKPDKKYNFAVRAFNRDAHSGVAYSGYVYTTPSAPSQPAYSNVRVTGSTEPRTSSVDFTWTYPSGQTQSVTQYTLSWTGPTSGSVNTSTMSATAGDLVAGGTYSFTVTAMNIGDGNDTVYGQPSIARVLTIPSAPQTAPVVTSGSPFITGSVEPKTSSITLSWSTTANTTSYVVRSGSNTLGTTSGTSITIDNLTAGTKYSLVVYPANDVGLGTPSNTITFTTAGLAGPPSINRFTPVAGGIDVDLGAGSPNGSAITKYQYRVTTSGESEVIPWTDVPGMSFTVTGVDSGTVYKLYVRSINGVGTGTQVTSLSSDAAGGRIAVSDGTNLVYRYIRTSSGIAPVRVYDGSQWVLTPF